MAKSVPKKLPNVSRLLEEAEKAPSFAIGDYWSTVRVLRGKGYSWRQIATWLKERGVPAHYKALERHSAKLIDENDMTEYVQENEL